MVAEDLDCVFPYRRPWHKQRRDSSLKWHNTGQEFVPPLPELSAPPLGLSVVCLPPRLPRLLWGFFHSVTVKCHLCPCLEGRNTTSTRRWFPPGYTSPMDGPCGAKQKDFFSPLFWGIKFIQVRNRGAGITNVSKPGFRRIK